MNARILDVQSALERHRSVWRKTPPVAENEFEHAAQVKIIKLNFKCAFGDEHLEPPSRSTACVHPAHHAYYVVNGK
jgi:hypothetical protein